MYPFRVTQEGIILFVKVLPKGSKTAVLGFEGDRLKIKVQAPADKGKANEALLCFLVKELSIAYSCAEIKTGKLSRLKSVLLRGCQEDNMKNFIQKWSGKHEKMDC